jgi:hypothetical protein
MIFKVIAFMIILSIFKEMDEAKEKKDLCEIVYWGNNNNGNGTGLN